jgi:hypothetical protein
MRRRGSALLLLLMATALAVGACANAPASPSAIPDLSTPSAEPAAPTAAELEAIRFRTENSLQADLEHVRAVAADPSAGMEFGVPLLPSEFDELMSRSANAEDIIAIVQAEAAKAPNDYCGMYLDNASEGAVTSLWKANRLVHEIAIRTQVRPNARIAFRDCRWSEPEQEAAMERIRSIDYRWMEEEIPAALQGYGFDTVNDHLHMEISSAVPNAADLVRRHYEQAADLPLGMLVVTSDGTGAVLIPWGSVKVTAVDADGERLRDSMGLLMLVGLDGSGPGHCGGGDMGYTVGDDGVGELPCQVGRWTIAVVGHWHQDTGFDVHGSARVEVREGEATKVTIVVQDPPTE